MTWYNKLLNGEKIHHLFGDSFDFSDLELSSIVFTDGPTATLSFTKLGLPSVYPEKWKLKGYNSVSLTLSLISVDDVYLQGWGARMQCSPIIEKVDGLVKLSIKEKGFCLWCIAEFAKIKDVSGCCDERI